MSIETIYRQKRPGWVRNYLVKFAKFAELVAGETISTATVVSTTPASGLTVGSASISGTSVAIPISGGTAGVEYVILVRITTSGGATLDGKVGISVVDD